MKIGRPPLIVPLIAVSLGCAACTETKTPEPDPAKLEALVASLDAPQTEAGKTERLIASVEKIPPERIDPNIAVAALTK